MLIRCARCGRVKLSVPTPRCMKGWGDKTMPEWWGMPAVKGGAEDKGKINHALCPDCARKTETGVDLGKKAKEAQGWVRNP